jgi:hypothetical protein
MDSQPQGNITQKFNVVGWTEFLANEKGLFVKEESVLEALEEIPNICKEPSPKFLKELTAYFLDVRKCKLV